MRANSFATPAISSSGAAIKITHDDTICRVICACGFPAPIKRTARRALATGLEEMGAAAFRADLASQRHETQYTRLFRS